MALPVTITTGGDVQNGCGGPFISSTGNTYVIVRDTVTTSKLRAFKASDPTSSFANVGTDPQVTSTNPVQYFDAYQVGDVLHVATIDATGGGNTVLSYHAFDMSSDTWTTTNESVHAAYAILNQFSCHILVRSDGVIIIFYNGPKNVANDSVYYAKKVSGTWTTDVRVDPGSAVDYNSGGALLGSGDRVHFIFANYPNAYQRTITSAYSLESMPAAFDTAIFGGGFNSIWQRGAAYSTTAGFKCRHGFLDTTNTGVLSVLQFDSSASPTTSLATSITGATVPLTANARTISLANDLGVLYNVFLDSSGDIYTHSNDNGAGWGAPASLYVGTGLQLYANVLTRSSTVVVAVAFSEGGNAKYHELTARSLTTGGFFGSLMMLGAGR